MTLVISSILSISILTGCSSNEEAEEQVEDQEQQTIEQENEESANIRATDIEVAYNLVKDYMDNESIKYIIEKDESCNLIVVKLPVNDIVFRLRVVQEEGYANEMLSYISTNSKNCIELITENGCNNLGVEFAIVTENNTK